VKKPGSYLHSITTYLTLAAVAAVLIPVFIDATTWPVAARNYLEQNGREQTGAINLVSAIYLGYRVFDTLGETIVLLVAVSGTIGILTRAGAILPEGYGAAGVDTHDNDLFAITREKRLSHAMRTNLLEVVTGVLGPIVLLFGFYVMLYGHLSPGGGFQGGVVIASGVTFIGLGNRLGSTTRLTDPNMLHRIEAASFLLLILASLVGALFGGGFFTTPPVPSSFSAATPIIVLNAVIGLKVGAGIGLLCIALLGKETR
jgi:multicomponent Na+:H+ antiporter subunit B